MVKAPGFRCSECGWTTLKWVGRCGECQQWGTVEAAGTSSSRVSAGSVPADRAARPITELQTADAPRWPTGISEFDRVLGGGIVPGAVVLCSGEPGVGKSTLLLAVAAKAASAGKRVLYVSGEESLAQVRLRAERTGALEPQLYLASETDLGTILGQLRDTQPELVIVDSVQAVANADNEGLAGGPSQVRDVASALTRAAKEADVPLLLVGHVTKDGSVAGPRVLEHLVDVVAHFDGDRQTALRFVRASKNRFGPTDEVGCFEMTGDGILEVPDPSGLFLSRSTTPLAGTCVTVALEGRRAIPVEVQALVVAASTPQPRRVVNGVDASRVAMVLAVLERHTGMQLGAKDVYVSTVGGIKLTEPGADLAIALAIASADRNVALPGRLAAIGELSLAGEVRAASAVKRRVTEARRLGYTRVIDESVALVRNAIPEAISQGRREAEARPRLVAVPDF
ncbi:DNA repair protein RadA [Agrococcus sp. ARC_14]|uniref:DNA repair protein RadA n=1 Tax=Agrococcus sp. ARC_14 TaxID=2919927 RepID=UPI001F064BE2|nr:DNA repair protein RadA [Agrococcus sp. ARC_14]MCH1884105.1 DNA repair protein RadA [Agrococcus sp. ARC_14]